VPTASAEATARHEREAHAAVAAWTREKKARLAGAPARTTVGAVAGDGRGGVAAPAAGAAEVSDWGAMDA
jgi:hypothetical protein